MVRALRVSAGEGGLPLCGVRLGILAAAISLAQETYPIRAFVAMQVTPTVIFVPVHPSPRTPGVVPRLRGPSLRSRLPPFLGPTRVPGLSALGSRLLPPRPHV